VNDYSESSDMAGSIMSVDFGLGMDYWVTDALFVGLVYNPLSFTSMNIKESTKTMKSGSNTTKEVTGAVKVSGLSTTGGFPLFRVGWRF
jgi:hypothetical protein